MNGIATAATWRGRQPQPGIAGSYGTDASCQRGATARFAGRFCILTAIMIGKHNVFLVGPMGSGKTAVGKCLARLMGAPFYDSDAQIEQRTGVDITFIFEKEGEAGFRQREREAIDALTQLEPIVLATGGGAVLLEENRRVLSARGFVVYLETSVAQQKNRVRRSRNRPLLPDADPTVKLTELMRHRGPLYVEVADIIVPTDGRRVGAVAADIMRGLKERSDS
jgi:shikimate kinase